MDETELLWREWIVMIVLIGVIMALFMISQHADKKVENLVRKAAEIQEATFTGLGGSS